MGFILKVRDSLFISVMLALTAFFSLFLSWSKDFSSDEIASVIITKNFNSMLQTLKFLEGNMWVYYFILHFWQLLNVSEAWIRGLSTIFIVCSVPFTYLIAKSLVNKNVARITSVLTTFHIFVIESAQNARSYALVFLLILISSYFFINYVKKSSKYSLFIYILVSVLAVYAHLYALLVLGAQFISLVLSGKTGKIKNFTFALIAILAFCLPLLLAPSMHSGQIDWITKPTIKNLAGTFAILADDFLPLTIIYAVLISFFSYKLLKNLKKQIKIFNYFSYRYLFLWTLFPIISTFIFSLFIKAIYLSTYFIICVVPFTIWVAIFIEQLNSGIIKKIILAVIIFLALIRLYGWYSNNTKLMIVIPNYNENWSKASKYLDSHLKSNEAILYFPSLAKTNIEFYSQRENISLSQFPSFDIQPNHMQNGKIIKSFNSKLLYSIPKKYKMIWYVYSDYINSDYEKGMINNMLKNNYVLKEKMSYAVISLSLYESKSNTYE